MIKSGDDQAVFASVIDGYKRLRKGDEGNNNGAGRVTAWLSNNETTEW